MVVGQGAAVGSKVVLAVLELTPYVARLPLPKTIGDETIDTSRVAAHPLIQRAITHAARPQPCASSLGRHWKRGAQET